MVPPTASFLKGADLLVASDCTAIAYPNFHRDFLEGKVVMVGCPKFDEAQAATQKFSQIFQRADIKSIEVVVMEVPCCQGMPLIVKRAMESAGKEIPLEKVIVSTRGRILKREKCPLANMKRKSKKKFFSNKKGIKISNQYDSATVFLTC